MPGAAHLLATNHVFNVAKPDGLTVLAANPNVAIAQLSKVEQVRFDVRKFLWIGSSGADGVAFSIRSDLPYKTFDELKKADKELVAGTTGPGSNAHDFPLLLKEFAGLKLKLVSGYPGEQRCSLGCRAEGSGLVVGACDDDQARRRPRGGAAAGSRPGRNPGL